MFSRIGKTLNIVFWVFIVTPVAVVITTPYVIFFDGFYEWRDRMRWIVLPTLQQQINILKQTWCNA
jgi:hypothetical protein